MSFDLPPQRKLTLNKMALGVLQPRTGQTIGVRTLVFLYSYLYGKDFLVAHKATIDFGNSRLHLPDVVVELLLRNESLSYLLYRTFAYRRKLL